MRLAAADYINLMERLGLFTADDAVPEFNMMAWRAYLTLYDAHITGAKDIEVVATPSGMGFYRDPLNEVESFGWALAAPISHVPVPFDAGRIIDGAAEVAQTFADDGYPDALIITDSMMLKTPPDPDQAAYFLWLNSPVAKIHADFEEYVAALKAKRRTQMRRLYRDYNERPDIRFDFSARPLTAAERDYVLKQTLLRWGAEDMGYALTQVLWPIAVADTIPHAARFMRVYQGDTLIFLNSYIQRGDTLYSQSTTRNEEIFMSGLGAMIDFKAIEILSGQTDIAFLDPTCRTCLEDNDTISIPKREIVTCDARKPLLQIGCGRDVPLAQPCYIQGWQLPTEMMVIGKAA